MKTNIIKRLSLFSSLTLSAVLASGCGSHDKKIKTSTSSSGDSGSDGQKTTSFTPEQSSSFSCTGSSGCFNVVNAPRADMAEPAVVRIATWKPGALTILYCSATFVAQHTVITAAHCVHDTDGSSLYLTTGATANTMLRSGKATKVYVKGDMTPGAVGADDVAIVTFATCTSTSVMSLAHTSPTIGDAVSVVGYGKTTFHDDAAYASDNSDMTKHAGSSVVVANSRRYKGTIMVGGFSPEEGAEQASTGGRATPSSGDSGSPLITDGQLNGVLSFGYSSNVEETKKNGVLRYFDGYVDVHHPSIRALIDMANKDGAEIPIPSGWTVSDELTGVTPLAPPVPAQALQ